MKHLLRTPVCDLLGCEHPVVLAGMGGVARSELVAAVSLAGGFGFLGMVREDPALIEAEVTQVRASSDRPFGVNLIPASTPPGLLEAQISVCLQLEVPVIGLFWEVSASIISRFRDAGATVVCQVGSPLDAAVAEAAGAQILIAQGVEAGGHVRGEHALIDLVPNLVASTKLPVLAAGALSTGADLAAMLALGAQGIVAGTAFLATRESYAHTYHKNRIVDARSQDTVLTDAFHINWPPGAKVRVLQNSATRGGRGCPFQPFRFAIGDESGRPIYLFSTDSPLRTTTGDLEAMALYAGQGVGEITHVGTAAERVELIVQQAREILTDQDWTAPPGIHSSSPPCAAEEGSDLYAGFAPPSELVVSLNQLLEAERAGARLTRRMTQETSDTEAKILLHEIFKHEARWCSVLAQGIETLGGTPSRKTSDFYEKALRIPDPYERLEFLNRGQAWVSKTLRQLLPSIRQDALHEQLRRMLECHDTNVQTVSKYLNPEGS